uniref:Serine protease persephone n=1 Tax=Culex pipiens TaxID=7175 RepID=A0A8D8HCR5_CULPI
MSLRSTTLILAASLVLVTAVPFERIHKYEGDDCPLKAGGTGVCRKTIECVNGHTILKQERHCEFVGSNPVVCCPKAEYTVQASRVAADKCGKVPPHNGPKLIDHVVGKTFKAGVGDFPFIGILVYDEENLRCAGSLISSKFLLTAAHCFKSKPTAVRMGTISATDALADSYPVANTFRHPDHNRKTKQNDIGLVELRTEVQMSANVEPICLHAELADLPPSADLTILGWGITNLDRQETSDDLLTGLVHPVPRSSCQSKYNDWNLKITERQLCAIGEQDSKGEYTDACGGDSGGPLVMRKDKKYFLVGVVSTGSGCGSGVPGLYTRVANYLQWTSERVWST